MNTAADPLAPHRRRLLGLAYRMLGDRCEADDVLQDAFLRLATAHNITDSGAFLTTAVTRLCLDRLKSARARRETYIGPWLPDPVLDGAALAPDAATELADDISFALMLTLERLTPAERAAFLLHDVFDLSFREVSACLGRNEASCRQLASRARRTVREERPRASSSPELHAEVMQAFAAAVGSGDLRALESILREDAVLLTDSGGLRLSARNPIHGADKIVRLLLGGNRRRPDGTYQAEFRTINGLPGVISYINGTPDSTMALMVLEGRVAAIYVTRHPEKLARLH